MQKKRLSSVLVLMMSVIILIGAFCLPASAATSIKNATVTFTNSDTGIFTYTGNAIKPKITVKVGKTKLTADKHYTVTYKNNKNVGKGTITIKGKGSYTGTVNKYFYVGPKAVSSLKATVSANKIKLTWGKSAGATAYQIQQKISGKWTKIATTSNATYTVTGLSGATKYEFRVRAYSKVSSKTLYSSYTSITKTTPLAKVTGISATDVTDSTATIKWTASKGATSYRVTITTLGSNYTTSKIVTTNSYKAVNLDPLSEHSVKVTAIKGSTKSAESAAYTFSTAPSAVKNLTATVSGSSVKVTWTKAFGCDGYMVSYSKLDSAGNPLDFTEPKLVTDNSYTAQSLASNSYYVFKVSAVLKVSSSQTIYSKEATSDKVFIPLSIATVPNFKAAASGTDSVALTWSSLSDIDGYKIYLDGSLVKTITSSFTTSYTITNLTAGKSYKVAICAYITNIDGATIEGEKTETTVTVATASVQNVNITSRPSTLSVGQTYPVVVSVTPENASNKNVTYNSSDTSVATISSTGLITAKAAGTTTIRVTSVADSSKSARFDLTVTGSSGGNSGGSSGDDSGTTGPVKVESVALKNEITLYEGDVISLNPTFTPANATDKTYTITGTSTGSYDFSKYISITSTNLIKADKATTDSSGNAFSFTVTIRTTDGNKTASTQIKVLPRMITVSYKGLEALPWYCGNSAKLSVKLNEGIESKYTASDIRFRSDNPSIASVTNDGTVTCKDVGDVIITAYTSDNKYQGDFKLYSRKGVKISKTFFDSCKVGSTYKISAEIIPSAGNDVLSYYSADSSIATVDNQGVVTFHSPGSVVISVHNASDPYPKQVWFTSNTFTAPSGSTSSLLGSMKTIANALKSRTNLPAMTRYDETVVSNFSVSSSLVSASELQQIFNSELSPKTVSYSAVVSGDSQYTTLKKQFMSKVPVADQSYVISSSLSESNVKNISVSNNKDDYYYELKLTLNDETMASLPKAASETNHGKVFDVLTSNYIDTYLNKINSSGSMSISYSSFAQRYHDSSLTLKINKATGNIEAAYYDMNIDITISKFKVTYLLFPTTMDISFKCNNIVNISFNEYN